MIKALINFINYWYFRYLLVTELYMVEKWERAMIHIVFAIFLALISLFNTTVTLSLVSWGMRSIFAQDNTLTNGATFSDPHSEF